MQINDVERQLAGSNVKESEVDFEDDESIVGTPFYLAPELWKSKRYAKESDIWALGVILYELCTLERPFPATTKEELK